MPPITLYFLQASRCIRIAWLLEELGLDYIVVFSDREEVTGLAPQLLKDKTNHYHKKFPTLKDGDLTIVESGAIAEYLMETYDKQNKLLPTYLPSRTRVREWLHAAEGTFLTHALAIARAKRFSPAYALTSVLPQMVKGMSVNVQKDLDWLENGLSQGKGKWLVGDGVTVADIMMEFSVDIIFWGQYGTEDKKWPNIERWLKECHESCGHKRAVKKTGYELKE